MAFDHKKYYQENKDRISKQRKKKYRSDKEHRDACRKRAREYSSKARNAKRLINPVDRRVIKDRKGRRFLTVGKLAELIKRTPLTIRTMEAKGVLPLAKYSDKRGWRLYTLSQAELVRKYFKKYSDGDLTASQLSLILHKKWDNEFLRKEGLDGD